MNKMKYKRRIIIWGLSFLTIGIVLTLFINIYMVTITKNRIIDINKINGINDVDAILILGCRVNGDSPSLMLLKRLEKGYDIYNLLHTNVIVSGNGISKDYDEVSVMEKALLDYGIAGNDIIKDEKGLSTYDSIYRAKYIYGLKKIIIVTQRYHLYRALYIADKLGIKAIGIEALDIPQKGVMLKNKIREVFARDKNFFKVIIKPNSNYLEKEISYS